MNLLISPTPEVRKMIFSRGFDLNGEKIVKKIVKAINESINTSRNL